MKRYFMDISYQGTDFFGYQLQPEGRTVESELERALKIILRKDQVHYYGAGRTDTGVHARQMFVHFDVEDEIPESFQYAMNAILPKDISINQLYEAVNPELHARFGAIARSYTYRICRNKNPFERQFSWYYHKPLDFEAMQEGAAILTEYKSFESLCKTGGSNKTFLCDIRKSYWEDKGEILEYHVTADRFLRGMVRAIVGTCWMLGKKKMSLDQLRAALQAKDRSQAGPAVPAEGLFLVKVEYPQSSMKLIPERIPDKIEVDIRRKSNK